MEKIGRDFVIYGLSDAIQRLINFLLLPLYTMTFSPSEYGILEILIVFGSLLLILFDLGLILAQSFYFYQIGDRAKVVSTVFFLRILWSFFLLFILYMLSPFLNTVVFGGIINRTWLFILFFNAMCFAILNQIIEIYRLNFKPLSFFYMWILFTFFSISMILFFLFVFKMGLLGYLIGYLIGTIITLGILLWRNREYIKLHLDKSLMKEFLRFSLPLFPGNLLVFLMTVIDRLLLAKLSNLADLGIYAVGLKFSMLVYIFSDLFTKSLNPYILSKIKTEEGLRILRDLAGIYVFIVGAVSVIITVVSPFIIRIWLPEEYFISYKFVGILCLSMSLWGFSYFPSVGLWKEQKTKFHSFSVIFGLVINILMNYILIKKIGALGASIAALAGNICFVIMLSIFSENISGIKLRYGVIITSFVISCILIMLIQIFWLNFWSFLTP